MKLYDELARSPQARKETPCVEARAPGREKLACVHQLDYFGAAPFDFGAMPIGHRSQIVVDWTWFGGERERDFGFARGPFLAAREQVQALANRFQRGNFAGEWSGLGRRGSAVVADQR